MREGVRFIAQLDRQDAAATLICGYLTRENRFIPTFANALHTSQ